MAVNLNGEIGPCFRSYKGLRQGDPLSPLLFNLVVDALSEILRTTRDRGVIHGVVPGLMEGGLTNLQYEDDTVLFLQYSNVDMINLKFIFLVMRRCLG